MLMVGSPPITLLQLGHLSMQSVLVPDDAPYAVL